MTGSLAQPSRRHRLLLEETLETDFKGYIYHPNLVDFDIGLENGLKQTREKSLPTLTGKLKNGYLNHFHILSSLFRQKPYAFSLLADRSREIENREFFERQEINSTRFGGNFGFRNDLVPVRFYFNNESKHIDRELRPSQDFHDDNLNLELSNDFHLSGETHFNAAQDKFSRTEAGTPDQKGTSRDFDLSNQKPLFDDNGKMLYSSMHYYTLSGTSKSNIFNLNENLDLKHNENLSSIYSYSYSGKSSSGLKSKDNKLSAYLRHRLYQSLSSSFGVYYFNSDADSFTQSSYGLSLDEDYTKSLGRIGRLTIDGGLAYSKEKRSASGESISIIDESQTLTIGTVTLLDKRGVDTSTVVVTDLAGTTTYTSAIDYQLTSSGERTQIQRIPGGSIADGQTVLADYQAQGSPRFKFNTLGEDLGFRMDFLEDLIGIFYRVAKEKHPKVSGDENAILQTLTDTTRGISLKYKNLRIELEDENYNSNLSPYKQLKLTESVTFNPTPRSALTLESSQSRIRLVDERATQKFFSFFSRFSANLNRYSRFNIEGGYRWQEGIGVNLNDTAASSSLEVNIGKFLMEVRYDFKKLLYLGDSLINHFVSARVRRKF